MELALLENIVFKFTDKYKSNSLVWLEYYNILIANWSPTAINNDIIIRSDSLWNRVVSEKFASIIAEGAAIKIEASLLLLKSKKKAIKLLIIIRITRKKLARLNRFLKELAKK